MATISNRFFVTVLEDGITIHGNLMTDKSLTQAWNGAAAIPDWDSTTVQGVLTGTQDQPTLTMSVLEGSSPLTSYDGYSWQYNGETIEFSSTETSFKPYEGSNETLQGYVSTGTYSNMFYKLKDADGVPPRMRIIRSLAWAFNVDNDMITFSGNVASSSGYTVEVSSSLMVRISSITAGSYVGVISFDGGRNCIMSENRYVRANAALYGGPSNNGSAITCYVKWYLNDQPLQVNTTTGATQVTSGSATTVSGSLYIRITESQVTDHAILRADFFTDSSYTTDADRVAQEFAAIDDLQDPEYMYIQTDFGTGAANGNAASLRSGESVTFYTWIGTETDAYPDVEGQTAKPYSGWSFAAKLLSCDGAIITGAIDGIGDPDANGYRAMNTDSTTQKASFTVTAAIAKEKAGKNMTGIILATHA